MYWNLGLVIVISIDSFILAYDVCVCSLIPRLHGKRESDLGTRLTCTLLLRWLALAIELNHPLAVQQIMDGVSPILPCDLLCPQLPVLQENG